MSEVTPVIHMSVDCLCTPPKRLETNEEKQTDRCEACGMEILTGVPETGPRMYLVKDEQA